MSNVDFFARSTPRLERFVPKGIGRVSCGLLVLLFALISVHLGLATTRQSAGLQAARAIGLAMFSYANDNNGKYPDGNSSTEAFQELMDGGYIVDPEILYFPLPGKMKGSPGNKLKPENVCWDITGGVTMQDADGLPIVFMTGWKVEYVPGGSAVSLQKFGALADFFTIEPRSWSACGTGSGTR